MVLGRDQVDRDSRPGAWECDCGHLRSRSRLAECSDVDGLPDGDDGVVDDRVRSGGPDRALLMARRPGRVHDPVVPGSPGRKTSGRQREARMNEADVVNIMKYPFTMIASDSGIEFETEDEPEDKGISISD